jgi:hypothetical protein
LWLLVEVPELGAGGGALVAQSTADVGFVIEFVGAVGAAVHTPLERLRCGVT